MAIWSKEADTIDLKSNWDEVPLYINDNLHEFISNNGKHFIVAPKGFGKTLLLKLKSKNFRDNRITSNFYPKDELCEKIGTGFTINDVIKFTEISHWEMLWDLSLSIVILQTAKKELPEDIMAIIDDANSVSDIISILLSERGSIYKLQSILPRFLRPKIRKIRESISIFVDNIDEAFVDHEPLSESNKIRKEKLSYVWRNAQLAFIESVKRIHSLNSHIKFYASVRLEAFETSHSSNDLQTSEYLTFIEYDINEIKEIFIENIRKTEDSSLVIPDSNNEIESFFGFNYISHPNVNSIKDPSKKEDEDIFLYLFRHTLGRPREVIEIGNKLKSVDPKIRDKKKIKRVIHEVSANLLNQYKKEVIPYFDDQKYETIKSFANTNILKRTKIQYYINKHNLDPSTIWNIIEYFYQLGLIGFVFKDASYDPIQKFRTVSEYSMIPNVALPNSEYYLTHPSVEEDLKHSNSLFFHNKFAIIGPNYPFHDRSIKKLSKCNLHLGAGRLGLGLVVPIMYKLGKLIVLQRCSPKWEKLKHDEIDLNVNGEMICKFRCFNNPTDINIVEQVINGNPYVLLITENPDFIRLAVNKASSITTALGPLGLKIVPNIVEMIDSDMEINIYPFENDRPAVKLLSDTIKNINDDVQVPFVVADRICSEVKVFQRKIDVYTEENYEVVINCLNGDVQELFEARDYNIQVTRSTDEYRYYYMRKYFLVNGIHSILAIYAYSVLLRKNIPASKWKNYEINLFNELPEIANAMDIFSVVQISRIMFNFSWEQFQRFFPGITKAKLFDNLLEYSIIVRNRFSNSPDLIDRVFSLKKQVTIQKKYEERIKKMNTFAIDNIDNINNLFTEIGYDKVEIKDILIEIANLLDKTTKLFLMRK